MVEHIFCELTYQSALLGVVDLGRHYTLRLARHAPSTAHVQIEVSKQGLLDLIAKAPKTLTDITLSLIKLGAGQWSDFSLIL